MTRAETAEVADVEIEVNYGAIRDQRLVVLPGLRTDWHRLHRRCSHRDDSGRCRLRQAHGFPHRRGVLDRRNRDDVRVMSFYRVFVTLEALDKRSNEEPGVLWTTRARTETRSADLRSTLPLLLSAAADYMGSDTGREVKVVLRPDIPQ